MLQAHNYSIKQFKIIVGTTKAAGNAVWIREHNTKFAPIQTHSSEISCLPGNLFNMTSWATKVSFQGLGYQSSS